MAAASHYLALVFGCLFILAGLVKLIPLDPAQTGHGLPEMSQDFVRFYDVLPFRDALKAWIKTPTMYMALVGFDECFLGALLAFGRPGARVFAAFPLLVIMIGAFYTLVKLGEPVAMLIPSVVFGCALTFIILQRQGLYVSSAGLKSKTS